jgi:LuxR family quorum-sensing system transcriptional regulator CciR
MLERVSAFVADSAAATNEGELKAILLQASQGLGFAYFALTHHLDVRHGSKAPLRLHNYPADWEHYFDEHGLGGVDPVHRASQRTGVGFAWSELPRLIALTPRDRTILAEAARHGIGDGFTVPAHVPGRANGSCSFAVRPGETLPAEHLAAMQLIGCYAFEAARKIGSQHDTIPPAPRHVSRRQRDCLIWVARGKSDADIAVILGLSPDTVHQYVKEARAAYDVVTRSQLVAHALFSGTISFLDVLRR